MILESTSHPGTNEELLLPILEEASGLKGVDFLAGFSPERIAPGNMRWSLDGTAKVVSGIDATGTRHPSTDLNPAAMRPLHWGVVFV